MRIYLDMSVYNRPFDNQSQPRIMMETVAFTIIFQMIEEGNIDLISSWVLEFENSRNPFIIRKTIITYQLGFASYIQKVNESIKKRANYLKKKCRLESIDALHLACAEAAGADHFLTCDDDIIKKYKSRKITVSNPVEFIKRRVK